MLRQLSIKDFAIIDDLRIQFGPGLSILSGETGAGKSIIINAVNLLLGSRATASLIRSGARNAELEAVFRIRPQGKVAEILFEHDYPPEPDLVIRRIISRSDRHKIYVNNRPGTVRLINALTENLASISGQHAHQLLLREDQHLLVLDQFGGLLPLREKVRQAYGEMLPLLRELKRLQGIQSRQSEQMDILRFQQKEIAEAELRPGEDLELEQEILLLKNAETLYQAVYSGIGELYSAQHAVVERLVAVKKQLEKACQLDPGLSPQADAIADTTFRIEDIVQELRDYLGRIQVNDRRLDEAQDRLDLLKRLKRKYGGSLEAVLERLETIESELSGVENVDQEIAATRARLETRQQALIEVAQKLSERRREAAQKLARKVEAELADLKMAHTQFEVALDRIPAEGNHSPYLLADEEKLITADGMDRASFLISPNPGEILKPLAHIASGGELSRVVLALKAILAGNEAVETVIFDEVDTGIGGGVAEVVGQKLIQLAQYHQIICITHLPQIAKFADHHFKIEKELSQGRTRTHIEKISQADRVRELARMMGGIKMTQATLDHASEMLENK